MNSRFRNKYNHFRPVNEISECPSATDPQYAGDCDINVVVGKFLRGAGLDVPNHEKLASYGDVSKFGDFAKMMNIVDEGKRAFMAVPSDIRARFGNDPKAFYSFVTNPENLAECVKLGLANIVSEDEPLKVQMVNPIRANEPPAQNT